SVFYEAIVDGLRAGAAEAGMPFEVRLVREDRTTPDAVRDYMQTAGADGLFLVGIYPNDMLRDWLQASMTPTVLVNGFGSRLEGIAV
ncbi:LacI family transcriptional regulator, partial [Rhizobium leguminosarum]